MERENLHDLPLGIMNIELNSDGTDRAREQHKTKGKQKENKH